MNFIGEWCRERCRIGGKCENCSKYCKPRFELAYAVKCSETTIWNLIFCNGYITHPCIADRIADHLGATAEQRDSIVHVDRRGGYIPIYDRVSDAYTENRGGVRAACMKEIVAIDRAGIEVLRLGSISEAAKRFRSTSPTVSNRCRRIGSVGYDEFIPPGVTFRYATEWDAMDENERKTDISRRNFPR